MSTKPSKGNRSAGVILHPTSLPGPYGIVDLGPAAYARNASWLDDFALYMALKDAHGGASWQSWSRELVVRQPAALKRAQQDLAAALGLHKFRQFLFFRQWQALKQYANSKGIKLIGDVPIFVASDSADVWHNPELFFLDERRQPTVVAGVPPDYFSATGQLWGNPLYNWDALRTTGD